MTPLTSDICTGGAVLGGFPLAPWACVSQPVPPPGPSRLTASWGPSGASCPPSTRVCHLLSSSAASRRPGLRVCGTRLVCSAFPRSSSRHVHNHGRGPMTGVRGQFPTIFVCPLPPASLGSGQSGSKLNAREPPCCPQALEGVRWPEKEVKPGVASCLPAFSLTPDLPPPEPLEGESSPEQLRSLPKEEATRVGCALGGFTLAGGELCPWSLLPLHLP